MVRLQHFFFISFFSTRPSFALTYIPAFLNLTYCRCDACNKLKPDFERFAGEYAANGGNSPLFVTADLEKLPEIARQVTLEAEEEMEEDILK